MYLNTKYLDKFNIISNTTSYVDDKIVLISLMTFIFIGLIIIIIILVLLCIEEIKFMHRKRTY